MKINNPTFGTDPEFCIVNEKTGDAVQVINFIPGSKKEPFDIGNGCGIQPDNVMVETTQPPVTNKEDFIKYFEYCRQKAEEIIQERSSSKSLKIKSLSSATYDEMFLKHPVARKFGCDPSFCIYTGQESPRPSPEDIGNLRSAGFHLHIGCEGLLSFEEIEFIIYLCDVYLGVPSILIDDDKNRRKIYGNAGDFRFKQIFGEKEITIVEYRTLGGAMHETKELVEWCFDMLVHICNTFNSFENITSFNKHYNLKVEDVKNAIDNENTFLCEEIIKKTAGEKIHSSIRNFKKRSLQLS